MIVASFAQQYGIRFSESLDGMMWDEFSALLSGIGPETPLGRIVSIRAEKDHDVLKDFTPEMHNIRSEWASRNAQNKSTKERDDIVEQMKQAFIAMAGGMPKDT